MIEFRTLGTLQLAAAEGEELRSVVAQPKRLALLCYLVLHSPDGYHRRDTLLGLLWPEYPEQRARHALSQALHGLRQGLGEGVVVTRGQEDIGIDRARLWCDAVAFVEAIHQQDYDAALTLYRGDLLEGFFVSEAAGFERWLGSERTRLQELAAGAAWRLAHRRIDEAELVEAERTAQRALSLVPTDESEVRRFVAALADGGDRAAAVRFYEKFADRLRDEYELEPAPETKQLIEVVRNRSDVVVATEPAYRELSPAKADAAPAVQGATQEEQAVAGRASRFPVRSMARAAIAVVIVLVVAVAVYWASRVREEGAIFVPNRVVVALFENQTGDSSLAPITLMAADWITDGLARTGMVEVITPAGVRDAFATAASQGTALFGGSGVLTLAESMHAGILVSGRLYRAADGLVIRAEVVRMPGVSALGAIEPVSLAVEDPGSALETLRQGVMGLLAIQLHPRLADWARTVRRPPRYEAYLEFEAGLGLEATPSSSSDRSRAQVRIQHMLNSAALDTTFVAPLVQVLQLSLGIMDIETRMRFCDSVVQEIRQRHN